MSENKDTQEVQNNLKNEFYTREGLWKSLPYLEYTKPSAQILTQQNLINTANNNNALNTQTAPPPLLNNNDPVKLSFMTTSNAHSNKHRILRCDNCFKQTHLNMDSKLTKEDILCEHCNIILNINQNSDFLLFNYSKELYLYHYNGIKGEPNEAKHLIDKKMYKSLSVTCHDINKEANTVNGSLLIAAGFSKGEIHVFDSFKKDSSLFFNNNSNEKLNDRSKATCVKWMPKSMNLFLVSHSSGSMYLYDINLSSTQQTQQTNQQQQQSTSSSSSLNTTQTPLYQVISEGECYKVETNVSIIKNIKVSHDNTTQLQQQQQNPLIKWTITAYDNTQCSINEFAFSPDGQCLAVACQDGYLRVFNYAEMQLKCLMKSYFGGLLCVCWSHDGKYIATGGEDDLITVYSFYDQRVACRGRGHSSWINVVQFDYWTSFYISDLMNSNDNDGDSDFEEYHQKQNKNNAISNSNKKNNSRQHTTSNASSTSYNKRFSSLSDYDQFCLLNKTNIYRLASVGQDNQIAFWDLSEDILKEKTHSRSRVTSIALNSLNISSPQQQQQQFSSTASTTKHEFEATTNIQKSESINNKIGTGLLKKNKRYPSLNLSKKSADTHHQRTQQQQQTQNVFKSKLDMSKLCPKLDEIPIIEPLICKRIANERITGLLFKDDCFLIASQDCIVSTWARPDKDKPNSSKSIVSTSQLSISTEKLQNSTSL